MGCRRRRASRRPSGGPRRRDRCAGDLLRSHGCGCRRRTRLRGRGDRSGARAGPGRRRCAWHRPGRRRVRRRLAVDVRRQRAGEPASGRGSPAAPAPSCGGRRARRHRVRDLHRRAGRVCGRWRLQRRKGGAGDARARAAPRAERRADPRRGDRTRHGPHRGVRAEPSRRRRDRGGGCVLGRRGAAAGGRRRRCDRLCARGAGARESRPHHDASGRAVGEPPARARTRSRSSPSSGSVCAPSRLRGRGTSRQALTCSAPSSARSRM